MRGEAAGAGVRTRQVPCDRSAPRFEAGHVRSGIFTRWHHLLTQRTRRHRVTTSALVLDLCQTNVPLGVVANGVLIRLCLRPVGSATTVLSQVVAGTDSKRRAQGVLLDTGHHAPAVHSVAGHRHDARAWGELFRSWVVARARMPTDTVATLLDGDIAGVARARAERALTLTLNVDRSQRIDRIVD